MLHCRTEEVVNIRNNYVGKCPPDIVEKFIKTKLIFRKQCSKLVHFSRKNNRNNLFVFKTSIFYT